MTNIKKSLAAGTFLLASFGIPGGPAVAQMETPSLHGVRLGMTLDEAATTLAEAGFSKTDEWSVGYRFHELGAPTLQEIGMAYTFARPAGADVTVRLEVVPVEGGAEVAAVRREQLFETGIVTADEIAEKLIGDFYPLAYGCFENEFQRIELGWVASEAWDLKTTSRAAQDTYSCGTPQALDTAHNLRRDFEEKPERFADFDRQIFASLHYTPMSNRLGEAKVNKLVVSLANLDAIVGAYSRVYSEIRAEMEAEGTNTVDW